MIYCALAHIFLATTIICLIVFIEKTIAVNRIQGAYVIRSTGQLIPFVIGVASMLATVKDISLDWLRDVSTATNTSSLHEPTLLVSFWIEHNPLHNP